MDAQIEGTAPTRLTEAPSWLLTQTAAHASRLIADGLAAVGARGYHYRLLAALCEYGPASQATLGRHSGIYVSDLVATINELVEQEAVQRSPDPSDKRRNVITITPEGERRLRWLDERIAAIQEELLAPLSPAERAELKRLLARMLEYHDRRTRR